MHVQRARAGEEAAHDSPVMNVISNLTVVCGLAVELGGMDF
eukprot:COSAG02_NODE_39858_length_412_cov_0.654952_1_plen_40_part_10